MTVNPLAFPTVAPEADLYGLAGRLLALVVDGLSSRSVDLPKMRYVSGGALPAYDMEQLTVTITQLADGRAGGLIPVSTDQFFMEQYVDLTVALVRPFPVDPPTPGPGLRATIAATQENLRDVSALFAVLRDIRQSNLLGDDNVPFLIPAVRTEGPLGGVVAAVGTVSLSIYGASW